MHSCTLVSALIADVNINRTLDDYLQLAEPLLALGLPKVLFLEQTTIDGLKEEYRSNKWTHIIPFEKCELPQVKEGIEIPRERNTSKDTLHYLRVINTKTSWVKRAVVLNRFNTTKFAWCDFGLSHMFHGDTQRYSNALCSVAFSTKATETQIRVAQIWPFTHQVAPADFSNLPLWYFAGGVFGGSGPSLIVFDIICRTVLAELMAVKNQITWDVNIWYMVWQRNKTFIQGYQSDHDPSVLENY